MRPIALRATTAGHEAPVTHVAFSPAGDALASASYDGSVVIWRVGSATMEPVARLVHRRLVNAASWSPSADGRLATASADKTIGVWRVDAARGEASLVAMLARHTDDVNALAWLPDGDRLVSVSEDSTALLWDVPTGRCLGRVTSHAGHCMDVAVSSGGLVLTVGEDGEAFCAAVDRLGSGARRGFGVSIEGCAWAPDGSRAALACDDGVVRIVSPDLDLLGEHPVSSSAARSVAFASDGSGRIVVGSYDASVLVLEGGRRSARRSGGRLWPRSVDTAAGLVAVGSFGSAPELLALDGLVPDEGPGTDTYGPNALAQAGGRLFVGLDAGLLLTLPVEQLLGGRRPAGATEPDPAATVVRVGADPVLAVATARAGLVASTYGGDVCRVDPLAAAVAARVSLGAPVTSLAVAPGGGTVLAGTYGGDVALLEVGRSITVTSRHHAHEGSVKSIAWWSPDLAVTGAVDGAVRAFSSTGPGPALWHHGNLVNAVAVGPVAPAGLAVPGAVVASAARDHLVRVGRPGATPAVLLGSDESMKAVTVLGDGATTVVLGGSYDFSCYAWRLEGGVGPDARAGEVLFSADQAISAMVAIDATTAVVASWDRTVRAVEWRSGHLVVHDPVDLDELVALSRGREVLVGGA